jgi:hypothetical protein
LAGFPVTGDCFQVAADLTLAIEDLVLCHGKPLGTGGEAKGLRYCHAWAEFENVVLDFSNGNSAVVRVEDYYALGTIDLKRVRRYTRDEAIACMRAYDHYGPWPEGDSDQ